MTREQLVKIEKLCNEATAGPWELATSRKPGVSYVFPQDDDPGSPFPLAEVFVEKDCPFIVEARTAIPQMLKYIRRLETIRDAFMELMSDQHLTRLYKLLNEETKGGGT